jgi:hypothetical protein
LKCLASGFPKPHRGLQSEIEEILCAVGLNLAALHLDQAARQRQADSLPRSASNDPGVTPSKIPPKKFFTRQTKRGN